jgi:Sec-independent protein translocase protein TatA
LSILEILLLLVVALIVIPPDRLPEVMQAVGKILRELRLASNMIMRELGAVEDPRYLPERPHNNPMTTPWSKGATDNAITEESAKESSPQP